MALVGREDELRRLEGLLEGIGSGGGAVLLRGEAGIGKSALLTELADRASTMGLRVLKTVGIESESHLQFAGLHQLLRPVRWDIDLLPRGQRDALRAALGLGEGTVPDGFLVALAALDLLSEIATREPVPVIAEDAQWLDRSSADVIAFLGRRLASELIVLAAAVREGVPSRFDQAGLPELVVPPLSREHAETLLDAHAAGLSESLRRRLLGDAAGNPLALIELPVAAQGTDRHAALTAPWLPLTERLERAFTARVTSLPELTATALLIAALDDGGSVTETVRAIQVLSGRKTGCADLAPAVIARLIEVDGDSLRFRHPLMRSAIHQLATAERQQAAHAALADVLADVPERSVWHRAAATDPPDEDVATELETVAQEALRRGAITGAATALEHAARLSAAPDLRADRLLHAADLAVELGRQGVVDRLLTDASRLNLSPQRRARRLDPGVLRGRSARRHHGRAHPCPAGRVHVDRRPRRHGDADPVERGAALLLDRAGRQGPRPHRRCGRAASCRRARSPDAGDPGLCGADRARRSGHRPVPPARCTFDARRPGRTSAGQRRGAAGYLRLRTGPICRLGRGPACGGASSAARPGARGARLERGAPRRPERRHSRRRGGW